MSCRTTHPIYGNLDSLLTDSFGAPYAVYSTIQYSVFTLALRQLQSNNAILEGNFEGHDVESILAYHRSISTENTFHPVMYIVVDKPNWNDEGVLLVNVDAYCDDEWKVKYMRDSIENAIDTLQSIDTGLEDLADWGELGDMLMLAHATHPIYGNPNRRGEYSTIPIPFATYNTIDRNIFNRVLEELNIQDPGEEPLCIEGPQDFKNRDINDIIAYHRSISIDSICHPITFIVVDDMNWRDKGVLLVNIDAKCPSTPLIEWQIEYIRCHARNAIVVLTSADMGDWNEIVSNADFGLQWDCFFATYGLKGTSKFGLEIYNIYNAFQRNKPEGLLKQRFDIRLDYNGTLLPSSTLNEIIEVHPSIVAQDPRLHPTLIIVFDDELWRRQKALFVNLDNGGRASALKLGIKYGRDLLASITLGEDRWALHHDQKINIG